jgi:SOS-response transcriptional repressor LexA
MKVAEKYNTRARELVGYINKFFNETGYLPSFDNMLEGVSFENKKTLKKTIEYGKQNGILDYGEDYKGHIIPRSVHVK